MENLIVPTEIQYSSGTLTERVVDQRGGGTSVRQVLQRPRTRIGLGIGVVVIVGVVVLAVYVFGGGRTSSGPLTTATLAPTKDGTIFTIDPSASEATFTIDEVLFGSPNTVVGKTSKVSGQIRIDKSDPSKSQVGQVRVDLSALATDNDFRNRTLQSRILETGQPSNQFATFTPTSLSGMPSTVAVGQQIAFQITGDLTIHAVTRRATFDVRVTATSEHQLRGQAQTTVKYADFGISIPSVPSVTGVSESVTLALTFTAHT